MKIRRKMAFSDLVDLTPLKEKIFALVGNPVDISGFSECELRALEKLVVEVLIEELGKEFEKRCVVSDGEIGSPHYKATLWHMSREIGQLGYDVEGDKLVLYAEMELLD